jgi:hypothetical protein
MLNNSRCLSPSFSAQGSASNPRRRCRSWSLAKPALGVALAIGVLTAGSAQAMVMNLDGQDLDVTTFNGTYNANTSKFETAAYGDALVLAEMPLSRNIWGTPGPCASSFCIIMQGIYDLLW